MATRQEYINAIDETFPVAGANNNSQGFRDNFANIKTALSLSSSGNGYTGSAGAGGGGGGSSSPATPTSIGSVLGYTTGTITFIGEAGAVSNTGTNNVAVGYNAMHFSKAVGPLPAVSGVLNSGVYNNVNVNTLVSAFAVEPITATQRIVTTSISNATVTALTTIAIPSVAGLTSSTTPNFGTNDDGAFEVVLPFDIAFLGTPYGPTAGESVYLNTNGTLTFGMYDTNAVNNPIDSGFPLISVYPGDAWTHGIYTGVTGTAPNRTFRIVVEASADWNVGQSLSLGQGDVRLEYTFYEASPTQIDVNVERNGQLSVISAATTSSQGFSNIAVGAYALYSTSTSAWGTNNIAIGECALYNEGDGNNNIAIGKLALFGDKSGNNNIAIGQCALYTNSSAAGYGNVAIGQNAMRVFCDSQNVAIGTNALFTATYGTNNIAIGFNSGCNVLYGGSNTIIGSNPGCATNCAMYGTVLISAGSDQRIKIDGTTLNTAVGHCAGWTNTGANNTFLGYGATGVSSNSNNTITLGNPSITAIRAQVTTITALSDCRDKTNIAGIPIGLDFIREVRPVQFDWAMRDGAKAGISEMGFIAQELDALQIKYGVESALGLVLKDNPDRLEATPGKLLPVVIKAIQELAAIVDQLGTK